MRHTALFSIILIASLLAGLSTAYAASTTSDIAKEKRWAEQIKDNLFDGELVWLKAKDQKQKFLGIYTKETAPHAQGGAILLHGMGAHPDWPDIIFPLRTKLPEYGWTTLSIQMPVLDNDASFRDYAPLFAQVPGRIDAAIALLKSKGISNIAIIGHSLGSTMGAYYLSQHKKNDVRAFVGIGMGMSKQNKNMDTPTSLAKIKIPVFDLYGEEDLFSVLDSVERRANAAAQAGNKNYYQLRVPGANHFFRDQEEILVKRVGGWLNRYAAGKELQVK
ncbi:hypothetical protein MNBD_GAMMA24-339 [hydrothermal vent metagenome]|uniref:DUF3530 family protein n=1 Tax=hydrothermal vent metagenome TaxID=652676 RepID=A0A3B1C855_9ZZZZ